MGQFPDAEADAAAPATAKVAAMQPAGLLDTVFFTTKGTEAADNGQRTEDSGPYGPRHPQISL